MVLKIAYFDNYVDQDFLKKITHCKIISSSVCYSNDVRLRTRRNSIATFHRSSWIMKNIEPSFGMLYELDVLDIEIFKMYHNLGSVLSKIEVSEIHVEDVESFMKRQYQIINHNVGCYCFVSSRTDDNINLYRNRKAKINFNKRLILNFLKL